MDEMVIIVLRPISCYDFGDVKVDVRLYNGDFNRAVREAIRRLSKVDTQKLILRYDVVSIEVI